MSCPPERKDRSDQEDPADLVSESDDDELLTDRVELLELAVKQLQSKLQKISAASSKTAIEPNLSTQVSSSSSLTSVQVSSTSAMSSVEMDPSNAIKPVPLVSRMGGINSRLSTMRTRSLGLNSLSCPSQSIQVRSMIRLDPSNSSSFPTLPPKISSQMEQPSQISAMPIAQPIIGSTQTSIVSETKSLATSQPPKP